MDLVFDKNWFLKNQDLLIWFCNTPLIKYWFRYILRLHSDRSGVGTHPIAFILPDAIFWYVDDSQNNFEELPQIQAEFRTHNKFSKRLYHAFKYIWFLLHFWDFLIADKFFPELSAGFSTLTVRPSAGDVSPVDGHVGRSVLPAETFSTIRAGAGAITPDTSGDTILVWLIADINLNKYTNLYRAIMCFDTSSLVDTSISAATLTLVVTTEQADLGTDSIHICSATPASTSTLNVSDYSQLGNVSFGSFPTNHPAGLTEVITLNSNGLANISLVSISKFGARLGWDLNNNFTGTWVSGGIQAAEFYAADHTGTTSDPKLIVTYTAAPAPVPKKTKRVVGTGFPYFRQ